MNDDTIFDIIRKQWEAAMAEPNFMRWKSLAEMVTLEAERTDDPGLRDLAVEAWRIANEQSSATVRGMGAT